MSRKQKIDTICLIVLLGFAFGTFLSYCCGAYLNEGYPHDTFLFTPSDKFADFSGLYHFIKAGNPYAQLTTLPYYPLANLVFKLFTLLPIRVAFIVWNLIFLVSLWWYNSRNLVSDEKLEQTRNVFICTFLTYPALLVIDRGNLECLVFVAVLFFAWSFARERYKQSAFFLSLAIAMKATPVVLAVMFLARRQYRAFLLTAASTVLVTLFSLAIFECNPLTYFTMALHGGNISHDNTFSLFLGANHWLQRGVSLFGLCKLALITAHAMGLMSMKHWLELYFAAAIVSMLLVGAYVIWIETEPWRQAALLVFMMMLLPPISADYRLLFLFIPMPMFVNSREANPYHAVYAVLFGLMLIPKEFAFIPDTVTDAKFGNHHFEVSIAMFLNPLLMLTCLTLIMNEGLQAWIQTRRSKDRLIPMNSNLPSRPLANNNLHEP